MDSGTDRELRPSEIWQVWLMAFRMVTGEIGALDHFKIENAHRQCLQGAHAGAQPHDSVALKTDCSGATRKAAPLTTRA